MEFVYLRYLVWVLPPRRGGTRRPPYLRRKYGGTRARATVADFGSFRVRGTGTRYVSAAGMPYVCTSWWYSSTSSEIVAEREQLGVRPYHIATYEAVKGEYGVHSIESRKYRLLSK